MTLTYVIQEWNSFYDYLLRKDKVIGRSFLSPKKVVFDLSNEH